jgi:hypothetical protein
LVTGYPYVICRIINFALNTISIYFDGFCRGLVTSFNKLENTSTSKCWDDKGFPHQGIVAGEELCGGAPRAAAREEIDDADEEPI